MVKLCHLENSMVGQIPVTCARSHCKQYQERNAIKMNSNWQQKVFELQKGTLDQWTSLFLNIQ